METVDQYNARRRQERKEFEDRITRTGVACPKCSLELRWEQAAGWSTGCFPLPTTRRACCRNCSLSVDLEA